MLDIKFIRDNLALVKENIANRGIKNADPDLVVDLYARRTSFLQALEHCAGDLILVSNEVGMSIVPMGALSRCFIDEAGWLNQAVAARCDRVLWVAAGLPLTLKG